jgi:hypothetical protein
VDRVNGFVVGSDEAADGHMIWKVRVKDQDSEYDKMKLIVASTHNEIVLAKGLNITFEIGTMDDRTGQEVLRAIDVRTRKPE